MGVQAHSRHTLHDAGSECANRRGSANSQPPPLSSTNCCPWLGRKSGSVEILAAGEQNPSRSNSPDPLHGVQGSPFFWGLHIKDPLRTCAGEMDLFCNREVRPKGGLTDLWIIIATITKSFINYTVWTCFSELITTPGITVSEFII